MKSSIPLLIATTLLISTPTGTLAQTYNEMSGPTTYLHPASNLTFITWTAPPGTSETKDPFTFGLVHSLTTDTSYTGFLKCKTKGWCGLSHGDSMLGRLLLVAWVDDESEKVKTEFRVAEGYFEPEVYQGTPGPVLEQLDFKVEEEGNEFEVVFRCEGCLVVGEQEGGVETLGYAVSLDRPVEEEGRVRVEFHDEAYGVWDLGL
ncbi:hypothetical protein QBC44DRAFT_363255 [Cladorrhinum sp. PSN332]|nr:hypothetical protein QBC44DRAFT_363255 [Cladorrhinum sp. PSN332]